MLEILKAVPSALSIPRADWDCLANPEGAEFNPLAAHDLFRCLEEAGCAAAKTGWTPRRLVMEAKAGRIAEGYRFAGWQESCRKKRTCSVTISGPKSVTAVFSAMQTANNAGRR